MMRAAILVAAGLVLAAPATLCTAQTLPKPTPAQQWYQRGEIHALIHFNMATFVQDGDPGCNPTNWDQSGLPSTFRPAKLDINQWAEVFNSLGAKGAILTAKHGCGHLLWPTKTRLPNGRLYPYCVGRNESFVKVDILDEFSKVMSANEIGHGFYYSLTNNFFLNVKSHKAGALPTPLPGQVNVSQAEFEAIALAQVTELWSNYGNLSEIWFDGGYTSDMKQKLAQVLKRQPNAIGFGGSGISSSPASWIGTESGHPNCPGGIWSSGASTACGDPSSPLFVPKTCDTTLQNGDHWFWTPPASDIRSLADLISVYHDSVGRNGVLELDMAVNRDGLIAPEHAARYKEFGEWIRQCYGRAVDAVVAKPWSPSSTGGVWELSLKIKGNTGLAVDRVVLREDLSKGQKVRSFDGHLKAVTFNGTAIGNRRVVLLEEKVDVSSDVILTVTAKTCGSVGDCAGPPAVNIEVFAPCASG